MVVLAVSGSIRECDPAMSYASILKADLNLASLSVEKLKLKHSTLSFVG